MKTENDSNIEKDCEMETKPEYCNRTELSSKHRSLNKRQKSKAGSLAIEDQSGNDAANWEYMVEN